MQPTLIAEEDPVWVHAYGVFLHVVRDLVKVHAWRGLRFVIVFFVGLGVLFCLSVFLIRFVVNMHAWYAHNDAFESLHFVVRAGTFFLKSLLFVLLERED